MLKMIKIDTRLLVFQVVQFHCRQPTWNCSLFLNSFISHTKFDLFDRSDQLLRQYGSIS